MSPAPCSAPDDARSRTLSLSFAASKYAILPLAKPEAEMTSMSEATRETLYRDLTETMLRLKLARIQRNKKDTEVFEKRLNWLLDRLGQACDTTTATS